MARYPALGLTGRMGPRDQELVEEGMRRMGISHLARAPMRSLSGGQLQRVYLAQVLARELLSLDRFYRISAEELEGIEGIGPEVAQSVYRFFNDRRYRGKKYARLVINLVSIITRFFRDRGNRRVIKRLQKAGVKITAPSAKREAPLKGKAFLFTGALEGMTRNEAKDLVEARGGEVVSSAGKGVDYVVVGKEPGSKYAKARELGLTIIDEEEFKRLVE